MVAIVPERRRWLPISRRRATAPLALGDLMTADGIEAVIEATNQAFGGIDILVNNAGGSNSTTAPDGSTRPRGMDRELPPKRATGGAAGPGLCSGDARRGWGRVIQISRATPSRLRAVRPYGAAKAALNNLTLSLSKALAGTGVTSNGIMPGLIYTPLVDPWFKALAQLGSDDPKVGEDFALKNVLQQTVGRLGQPKDIAAAVCFFQVR